MLGESDETEGVLKVNSRILEAHELKKLDKSEKSLVNAIHSTGKGRRRRTNQNLFVTKLLLYSVYCVY